MVRQIVSETIVHDVRDPRVSSLTTVTRVEVSGDLLIAKVFLSVRGTEAEERRTLAGVSSAAGFLQRKLASVLSLRQCPELRFSIDPRVKGTRRVMELLDQNREREPQIFETGEDRSEAVPDAPDTRAPSEPRYKMGEDV